MGIDRRQLALGTFLAPAALMKLGSRIDVSTEAIVRHAAALAKEAPEARTLRLLIPEGSGANLAAVTESFLRDTGVATIVEEVPTDDVATVMTVRTLAGAARFDVALPPTFSVPGLVEAGVILPLDELPSLRHRGSEARSLFPLGDRYKDKTYGFQTDGDVYLMFYNRRFSEDPVLQKRYEDRYEEPLETPTTWDQLDRQLAFFHRPDAGRFGGTLFRTPNYIAWEFWARLHAKGSFPVDDQMRPLLDDPSAVEAAEELVAASEFLSPGAATNGIFDNWSEFSRGHAYCNIGWGGSMKYFRRIDSKIRDDVATRQLPGGVDSSGRPFPTSYFNWGWNYAVSSQARCPDMGAAFALYATSEEPSLTAVRAGDGFFDPFLDAHYKDKAIEKIYSRPFLREHRKAMDSAFPDFYLNGRIQYFDLLGRFLDRANRGRMTVKEALGVVSKGWEQITESMGRVSQIDQWRFLRTQYPARLRAVLEKND